MSRSRVVKENLGRVSQARGSTPIEEHISWNCFRNCGFFLISSLCFEANSSKFFRKTSICDDIWNVQMTFNGSRAVRIISYTNHIIIMELLFD